MSKIFISLLSVFLLIGCKTTEDPKSASLETKLAKIETEINNLEKEIKKEEETKPSETEVVTALPEVLPPGLTIQSMKPVICGETGEIFTRMGRKYGERAVMGGQNPTRMPDGSIRNGLTAMLYNAETKTYTFLEQMPGDDRIMCMLSSGTMMTIRKDLLFPTKGNSS